MGHLVNALVSLARAKIMTRNFLTTVVCVAEKVSRFFFSRQHCRVKQYINFLLFSKKNCFVWLGSKS